MPYAPPLLHRNAHLATILPNRLRPVSRIDFKRKTIETPDQDFLDLDIFKQDSSKLAIVLHGLEGSSDSTYISGMTAALIASGYDVLAMNQRSCSGRPNRLLSSYHSGKTDDLDLVINQVADDYESLTIIGFSLGGNITLKYAGEYGNTINPKIKAAVGVSVPVHLSSSSKRLESAENFIYRTRFLRQLKQKVKDKLLRNKSSVFNLKDLAQVKTIRDFDDYYTAPVHGFDHAEDYYSKSSSLGYLTGIQIPTMLLNAQNDPFLSPECFPSEGELNNPNLQLLYPSFGGHVGFALDNRMKKIFWHEQKVIEFLNTL